MGGGGGKKVLLLVGDHLFVPHAFNVIQFIPMELPIV